MNAILLSLKPRFCNLIISGVKTIEIRKSRPACALPFKVYVYCSERNTRNPHHILEVHSEGKIYRCNGKIIGEFICEEIISSNDSSNSNYSALEKGSCLSSQELSAYGREKPLYGWRISSFHLYDRPQDMETLCTTEGNPIHRPPQSWCYAKPNMSGELKMLTIPIRSGNILHSGADIIVQQVNCRGVMGAGLAKQIATRYPDVLTMYKKYCQEHPEPSSMLGKVLFVETERTTPIIANIFGQNYYGRKGCFTDYAALEKGLASIVKFAEKDDMRVAIPYGLGCGLAGGNWNIVYGIIARQFEDYSRADIWAL